MPEAAALREETGAAVHDVSRDVSHRDEAAGRDLALAERYVNGECCHMHFRTRPNALYPHARDLCVALQRDFGIEPLLDYSCVGVGLEDWPLLGYTNEDGCHQTVFVGVPESLEVAERVWRVPSTVRLEVFDDLELFPGHMPQGWQTDEVLERRSDREVDLASILDLPLVGGRDELPHKVIERRPQVVDVVSNDQPEDVLFDLDGFVEAVELEDDRVAFGLWIRENEVRVRLDPVKSLSFEFVQVVFGPLDLCAGVV